MTIAECAKLLTVIAARYPASKLWEQEAPLTAQAWHLSLADVPYEAAERALARWFRAEKWAPDPSELRDMVAGDMLALPTTEEAWDIARTAIAIYYPGMSNAYDVPSVVRSAINAIGGVHNLKMSQQASKDREAFFRVYPVYRKRVVEQANLLAIGAPEATPLPQGEDT